MASLKIVRMDRDRISSVFFPVPVHVLHVVL